jgi:poly-gamma-glutamate capsule biosynthesis protein CapA/YwtB (metallophosphatase superfamily)
VQPSSHIAPSLRLMLGGDLMLGRLVKQAIRRFGPVYPLAPIASMLRGADLAIVNLECALTASHAAWPGEPKAFYFGAPPEAVQSLVGAGIDMVSLANNHALDFGVEGLLDTLQLLRSHAIGYAGAGAAIDEARAPAVLERKGISVGMAAFCDHQQDFAAQRNRPGTAFLDLSDERAALAVLQAALVPLRRAAIDWPILSLHWGPNMVHRPSARFRRLAHAAIDMGWKILFGHSAHVFHGIEIFRACPIIYAAGDLVDDYYVDPEFRNDHQLLFELELTKETLRSINLYPVFIDQCQAHPANREQTRYIAARMKVLCREMGTPLRQDDGKLWITIDAS